MRHHGTWDIEPMILPNGDHVKNGKYVMVKWGYYEGRVVYYQPPRLGICTGVMTRKDEILMAGAKVLGVEGNGLMCPNNGLRLARYREFRWNKTGFGLTKWRQYWITVCLFLTIAIGGAVSMEAWWVMPSFFAIVYGVTFELQTWRNFTGRSR